MSKAIDELLCDCIDKQYNGYIDIWFKTSVKQKEVIVEAISKNIPHKSSPSSAPNSIRFHIDPAKGVKLIR